MIDNEFIPKGVDNVVIFNNLHIVYNPGYK